MKPASAYLTACAVAGAELIAVTALWIVHLRTGPPLDGWVAGPMVVAVPFALLFLFVIWLIERALLGPRIAWTAVRVLIGCGILAYAVTTAFCGPTACFRNGPNRAMGWFIVLGVVAMAVTHHLLFMRLRGVRS
jgi:hypothetical protein